MFRDRARQTAALLLAVAWLTACGRDTNRAAQAPAQPAPSADTTVAPQESRPKIVAFGDSLTAGLGLPESQAYPALLQQKLDDDGYHFDVVNAGVSGDTSAAGLQRLDWTLDGDVRILILALGANDGLRGLPPSDMENNLAQIIERTQQRKISVLLLGMEAPPNYGPEYAASFRRVYRDLARRYDVPLVPFMLDKVAGESALNQGDGIHPNAQGTEIVAATIWHALKPVVDAVTAS
jgi:acyl-CoA thioesterase-1